nr:unnamed protein product [Pongo abelii]
MLRRLARAAVPAHGALRAGSGSAGVAAHVVGLRSDKVTRPGPAMRRVMAEAVVGDDDYGEDRQLQEMAVELLGLGRTLFVPSNTMANLISVMCHCRRRGSQLLLGQECHLHVYEQGGAAQVRSRHSPDLPPASLHPGLAELERMITRGLQSPYHQVCELICLENSHSISGVPVLPIDYLRQVHLLAQTYGPPVHLDGAQLMNVALALHVPPTHIVEHCDSVSFCLSKGLGAPVGSLAGRPKDFIEEAWRLQKALGGSVHQVGMLAVVALVGLVDTKQALWQDHRNAQRFTKGLQELVLSICSVYPTFVETNMAMVSTAGLRAVSADEVAHTGHVACMPLFLWTEQSMLAVWHRDVSAQDTELVLRKWEFALRPLES